MKNSETSQSLIHHDIILDTILAYGSDVAIVVTKDFGIQILNSASEKFYNWTLKSVRGKNFLSLCKEQNVLCPIPDHFFKHPELLSFNLDCKNASENECNLNWIISPLILPNNVVVGALIIGKDIGLKKNNIAYYLNGIIDAIPGCLYWKDCNGYYLGCNHLTAQLAGLPSPYDVIGKTDKDLWGEQAANIIVNDKEVITKGNSIIVEEKLKTATGQWIHFTGVKMPLRDENNVIIGLIGNSLDITELKKTQAELKNSMELAKAANQAKSDFIANMSHDIRTPLSGIVGMSKLLEEAALSEQEKQYARWVNDSGNQLLELLNGVLDVISADHVKESELHEETFDLYKTIQSIGQLELPALQAKHIEFKVDIEENVPRYIISDKAKFHRILLNLLGNAIKFTETGYVQIGIKQLARHKSTVKLEISVEDTGIGIPEQVQAHLFDRFFKVNPSYKGIYRGHGLGLHIAQQYVSFLKGEIHVKSQVGKGTRFYFSLTLKLGKKPEQDLEESIEDSILSPSPTLKKSSIPINNLVNANTALPHLLLVEDNAIALRLLETLTNQYNCRFTSAIDGEQALELAKHTNFDLIVTDIGLPGISGVELTQAIREWEKSVGKKASSIVGLTAHALQEAATPCIQAGMNKVLQKPIRPEQMQMLIEQFIQSTPAVVKPEPTKVSTSLGLDLPDTEEQLFQLETYPVLDINNGIQSLGSEELLIELLGQLINDDFPKDVMALEAAYSEKNWPVIEKIAHKLKGGAVYCGTVKLKQACQYLERYQKAGHSKQLNDLALQLFKVIEETKQVVAAWLKQ